MLSLSISSSPFVTVYLFDYSHSSGCEVIPHFGFDLHFLKDYFKLLFMSVSVHIYHSSLVNSQFISFAHFKIELFFIIEF
jgi:hypothetical protein